MDIYYSWLAPTDSKNPSLLIELRAVIALASNNGSPPNLCHMSETMLRSLVFSRRGFQGRGKGLAPFDWIWVHLEFFIYFHCSNLEPDDLRGVFQKYRDGNSGLLVYRTDQSYSIEWFQNYFSVATVTKSLCLCWRIVDLVLLNDELTFFIDCIYLDTIDRDKFNYNVCSKTIDFTSNSWSSPNIH